MEIDSYYNRPTDVVLDLNWVNRMLWYGTTQGLLYYQSTLGVATCVCYRSLVATVSCFLYRVLFPVKIYPVFFWTTGRNHQLLFWDGFPSFTSPCYYQVVEYLYLPICRDSSNGLPLLTTVTVVNYYFYFIPIYISAMQGFNLWIISYSG